MFHAKNGFYFGGNMRDGVNIIVREDGSEEAKVIANVQMDADSFKSVLEYLMPPETTRAETKTEESGEPAGVAAPDGSDPEETESTEESHEGQEPGDEEKAGAE